MSRTRILGIVAEYDPFHLGHLYHLTEAKKQVNPDWTLVVLSPCIKQRGALSMMSPADRAMCALEAGADAVFALPVSWTVRDAEHYAEGAVSLLASLGATHLAFGAETAQPELLRSAAEILEAPSAAFSAVLKQMISDGTGYPAALSSALNTVLPDASGILDSPNNTLAVCYLRAMLRLGLSLTPVVIPRRGAYHANRVDPAAPSASALRESLLRGNYAEAFSTVPVYTARILQQRFLEDRIPDEKVLDVLLLSRLRAMTDAEYRQLPDVSEGMENMLRDAAVSARTMRDLVTVTTCRRYSSARISRLCICALLGLTRKQLNDLPLPGSGLLLGLRRQSGITSLWKKSTSFPVVASFTEWKKAASPADLTAWRLWAQCCRLPDTLPFTEPIVTR